MRKLQRNSSIKLRRKNLRRINAQVMPKNTDMRLIEMAEAVNGPRTEFNKGIETVKKTQAKMKME